MGTGINQLVVGPKGGSFILGGGDASLEFPSGAVEKEIFVHYAVILHGPFVFPAGYKPGSVVVYINMDETILMKPIRLLLSHWCIREEGDGKDTLKFVSAPHSLEAGQQKYTFEEEEKETDFTTCFNVGVLTIRDPHCLFCVETKSEKIAKYSAITFSHYDPSEETLLFRIQFMCNSLEWNEVSNRVHVCMCMLCTVHVLIETNILDPLQKLTDTLQQKDWKKTCKSDDVIQFQYAPGHEQIKASPPKMSGPGWEATIHGLQAVSIIAYPIHKTEDCVMQAFFLC